MAEITTPTLTAFRDRIVGEGWEDPEQLLANPKNWRIHPKTQEDALEAVLRTVGWVQRVIVNRATGFVVDGHLRVALAIRVGEPKVPVSYVELTPDEEDLILTTFDPISAMAGTDREKLEELLGGIRSEDERMMALLDDIRSRTLTLGDAVSVEAVAAGSSISLVERFGVPPFSVLDARQGYWQERKRAWLALGIKSELGRGGNIVPNGSTRPASQDGAYMRSGRKGFAKSGAVMPASASSPSGLLQKRADQKAARKASPGGSPRPAARLARRRS